MPFEKGNTLRTGTTNPNAGRKKSLKTQIDEAMEVIDEALPDIVLKLVERAKEGDREALIYLIDRRMGKPKADIDLSGGEGFGVGVVVELLKALQKPPLILYEPKLLEGGVTNEEKDKGRDEGVSA